LRIVRSILNLLRFNKKNWKAVALCIFAATVFWFFNALNKTYTANIKLPLTFDFNAGNYVAVSPLPNEVSVNVSGIGWNLLRKSSGLKTQSLVIPLERPSEVKKIVGSTLPGLFANQLPGLEINFVLTDTLLLNIHPKAGRWLKLSLDSVEQYLKRDYVAIGPVRIIPDSVFVEGPLTMVTKLHEPTMLALSENNIDRNFRQDVEVILPNNDLMKRNPPTVAVAFDVEHLIERHEKIKLTLENVPAGVKPVIGEAYIPCVFSITETNNDDFVADSVTAVIDLKGFKKGELKLLPTIQGLPPLSRVERVDSIRVKL